ncbi:ornithine carbamoyltransferase [Gammaproteobacteria bacterium]|nr:ornithine carbamoyltransferase [Gammaproteobacteria bacterium]
MMKHFINFDDFSNEEIKIIINKAIELKAEHKAGKINNLMSNKTLGMIFDKSSTRTRVSFEAGMTQLGGHALFLSEKDIQLGRGEPLEDSAIVISSMVDMVMLRISSHKDIELFANKSSVPVINALSDDSHPCQLLADMMTFKEHIGEISGKTVAWIGDGNNMCQTYMQASKVMNFNLKIACPSAYHPNKDFIKKYSDSIELMTNPQDAARNADLIVTDVWASMGQEEEQNQRLKDFDGYQVNKKLMGVANSGVIFMHCLPAHRGEEVSAEIIEGDQSVVWDEAENRLHAQKALILNLLG